MANLNPSELEGIITEALMANRTAEGNARSVARALVLAEIDGKKGHGLSRVPSYAGQAQSGKVDGHASPGAESPRPGVLAIDSGHGFAYPAFDLMQSALPEMAQRNGIAMAAIRRSHHYGVAGHHVEKLADQGLVALLFGNTPAAMAPWGRQDSAVRHQPHCLCCPRCGEGADGDRPCHVTGGAGQYPHRQPERQPDP